ncbi:MAG: hypothetical protein FRX48_00013 [Lasallia pustulata]|uniref:Heme haloperoxidase family profile domain-containing protein n=1 Tax=Lasallia pustulata TaxID=136370 RepID=A0A5M8PZR2_9LECA|nr:MAG: hypothetical protein FRX48_00013 [Lasallia pustulata]
MASPTPAPPTRHLLPPTHRLRSPAPSSSSPTATPREASIHAHEFRTALSHIGVSSTISSAITYAAYLEHLPSPPRGIWAFIHNPLAYFLRRFGLRNHGQRDATGEKCLDLDQLDRHGAIEHDVSLSRRDKAQGDNHSLQPELVEQLLAAASDGKVLTTEDFARLRRTRIAQQRRDNPELEYGTSQHTFGCAEEAFIQTVFGGREGEVPVKYVRALFAEERLPVEEGWRGRWWWKVGFLELNLQAERIKKMIGSIK